MLCRRLPKEIAEVTSSACMLPSLISWLCSKSMRPSPTCMYSDYFSSKVHWHPGVNTDSNGRLELWDSRSRGDARRSRRTRTDPRPFANRREHKLKSSRAVPWPLSFPRRRAVSSAGAGHSSGSPSRWRWGLPRWSPRPNRWFWGATGPGDDGNFVVAMAIGFCSQLDDPWSFQMPLSPKENFSLVY